MFYYLGEFGQAVLWSSLPDRATKKKEKWRSLYTEYAIQCLLQESASISNVP